jgi:hypothetical protein
MKIAKGKVVDGLDTFLAIKEYYLSKWDNPYEYKIDDKHSVWMVNGDYLMRVNPDSPKHIMSGSLNRWGPYKIILYVYFFDTGLTCSMLKDIHHILWYYNDPNSKELLENKVKDLAISEGVRMLQAYQSP